MVFPELWSGDKNYRRLNVDNWLLAPERELLIYSPHR